MVNATRRILVIHPFLFAAYSVLGIYSQNASQVPAGWIFRSLAVLLLFTAILYACLQKILKDHQYSGFVTTLFLNWVFMGHLYRFLLEQSSFWRTPLGGICAFLLVSVPLGFLGSRWVWNKLSNPRLITTLFNVVALALLAYPLWITINTLSVGYGQTLVIREQQARFDVPLAPSSQSVPDIYLIIVDGYGRADFLMDTYGYDNAQFIEFLKGQGFYVADRATPNYPLTELSIPSMLNFQYLDEYTHEFAGTNELSPLYELIQHSASRRLLKDQGYTFVALPSASLLTQVRDADIYFNWEKSGRNEFESLLLSTTLMGVAAEAWGLELPVMSYELHRKYIVYSLDKLRDVPDVPGPKFVFAHIMLPHPPFIFDRAGNFVPPDRPYVTWDASLFPGTTAEYQEGYISQMTFLNQELMEIISDILTRSEKPPIIILQGDHGPGAFYNVLELDTSCLAERYSILNAYYFPDGDYQRLYPSITPVNSFRVILNQYFGARLDLLEDRNYFAGWLSPYVYTDVTDQIHRPCNTSAPQPH